MSVVWGSWLVVSIIESSVMSMVLAGVCSVSCGNEVEECKLTDVASLGWMGTKYEPSTVLNGADLRAARPREVVVISPSQDALVGSGTWMMAELDSDSTNSLGGVDGVASVMRISGSSCVAVSSVVST